MNRDLDRTAQLEANNEPEIDTKPTREPDDICNENLALPDSRLGSYDLNSDCRIPDIKSRKYREYSAWKSKSTHILIRRKAKRTKLPGPELVMKPSPIISALAAADHVLKETLQCEAHSNIHIWRYTKQMNVSANQHRKCRRSKSDG